MGARDLRLAAHTRIQYDDRIRWEILTALLART